MGFGEQSGGWVWVRRMGLGAEDGGWVLVWGVRRVG